MKAWELIKAYEDGATIEDSIGTKIRHGCIQYGSPCSTKEVLHSIVLRPHLWHIREEPKLRLGDASTMEAYENGFKDGQAKMAQETIQFFKDFDIINDKPL